MPFKSLTSWNYFLAALAVIAVPQVPAIAATAAVETAIRALDAIPADAQKFEAYCKIFGELANAPDGDEAKYEALEQQFEQVLESYGAEVEKAWDTIEDVDPDTEDAKAISAAFEAIDAKCP